MKNNRQRTVEELEYEYLEAPEPSWSSRELRAWLRMCLNETCSRVWPAEARFCPHCGLDDFMWLESASQPGTSGPVRRGLIRWLIAAIVPSR